MIDNYKEIMLEYSKSGAFYSSETQPCDAMILGRGWYIWMGKICCGPFRTEGEAVDYAKRSKGDNDV